MNFQLGEWRAALLERPGWNYRRIYLMRDMPTSSGYEVVYLNHDGAHVHMPEGSKWEDDNLYFAEVSEDQLAAILTAANKSGARLPSNDHMAGLLEAKDAHLEDMRSLVFKEKK